MPSAAEIYYYVYEGGEGGRPSVVLIHGAGGTHLYWPSEVRRLPGYRMLALDLPGHGKSGGRGLQSIDAYGEAVLHWMEEVSLHRAVFVGHSMGGAIAMRLALEHPEQVSALGLLGAGGRLRVHPDTLQNTGNETTFQSAVARVVGCSFSGQAPERLVELAARRMAETRPSVLHGDFVACDGFDEMERVSEISQPTLVICGADDQLTPTRYAQFLADQIPGAHLEIIPEAGHMVMLERPNVVADVLVNFLDGIPY